MAVLLAEAAAVEIQRRLRFYSSSAAAKRSFSSVEAERVDAAGLLRARALVLQRRIRPRGFHSC